MAAGTVATKKEQHQDMHCNDPFAKDNYLLTDLVFCLYQFVLFYYKITFRIVSISLWKDSFPVNAHDSTSYCLHGAKHLS